MPRNRQQIPREERVLDILDVAVELFAERDFEHVTMAAIAGRTGVRNGAIYWYFESKDHLLAAAIEQVRTMSIERLGTLPPDASPAERLILHLSGLRPTRLIHASAHARARLSPAVAAAHEALMEHLRELIAAAVQDRPAHDREMLTALIVALFEGANDPDYRGPSATDLVAYALELVSSASRTA